MTDSAFIQDECYWRTMSSFLPVAHLDGSQCSIDASGWRPQSAFWCAQEQLQLLLFQLGVAVAQIASSGGLLSEKGMWLYFITSSYLGVWGYDSFQKRRTNMCLSRHSCIFDALRLASGALGLVKFASSWRIAMLPNITVPP